MTLSALVGRSDTIVAGEVLDLQSSWTADRSEIFTTVVLRVDRRLKGTGRDLVRFRVPGGRVGEDWLHVTHTPRFELGESALVFLRASGGRLPTVVGMEDAASWRSHAGEQRREPPRLDLFDSTCEMRCQWDLKDGQKWDLKI